MTRPRTPGSADGECAATAPAARALARGPGSMGRGGVSASAPSSLRLPKPERAGSLRDPAVWPRASSLSATPCAHL